MAKEGAAETLDISNAATVPEWVLDTLQHPVIMLDAENRIAYANLSAEVFFQSSKPVLKRHQLEHFLPFGSPVIDLARQVREQGAVVNEYKVDISSPRLGKDRVIDVYAASVFEQPGHIAMMFQVRSIADKIDRQLTHRNAARSVTGLAAMLAHEIKNPLSGIRGAAQLLESSVNDEDRQLTQLIRDETDRIVKLVDRMEVFSDERPIEREPVNIHSVLEHIKKISENGFAKGFSIVEEYDPSLPPVLANRDQLIQVVLNLAKNASEALEGVSKPEIKFSTAFQPGIRLSVGSSSEKVTLPLELCISDNGPGIPDELRAHIFDPFVTSKVNGSGLGLALVAKIIGDHGGIVECDSSEQGTTFRILLPAWKGKPDAAPNETQETS